ncbi:MAG: DUF4349 domain-containing protein [Bacillota bacterium]
MNCSECMESLSPYIDGELTEAESERVDEHLSSCAKCRAELEALKEVVGLCRSMEDVEVPSGFRASLMAKVKAREASPWRKVARRFNLSSSKVQIAAAFLVVIIGITYYLSASGGLFRGVGQTKMVAPAAPPADYGAGAPAKTDGSREFSSADTAAPDEISQKSMLQSIESRSGALEMEQAFDRKVIKRADVEVRVDKEEFEPTFRKIPLLAESLGGYVQESALWKDKDKRFGRYVLRIPERNFAVALDQFKSLGEVINESVAGQDVTQEYVDTESRLRALKTQEQRLLVILGEAKTVDEILRIEMELTRVRTELEMYQGSLRYLDNLVSLSTINLNLRDTPAEETPKEPGLWDKILDAFRKSIEAIVDSFSAILVFLAGILPVVITVAAGVGILFRLKRTFFR